VSRRCRLGCWSSSIEDSAGRFPRALAEGLLTEAGFVGRELFLREGRFPRARAKAMLTVATCELVVGNVD
jgi:hypothetical protein